MSQNFTIKFEAIRKYFNNHSYREVDTSYQLLGKTFNVSKKTAFKIYVFAKKGASCMCCGADDAVLKLTGEGHVHALVNKSNKYIPLTVDHNMLKCLGGPDTLENLNPLCTECNSLRGNFFGSVDNFIFWYHNEYLKTGKKMKVLDYSNIDISKNADIDYKQLIAEYDKNLPNICQLGNLNNIHHIMNNGTGNRTNPQEKFKTYVSTVFVNQASKKFQIPKRCLKSIAYVPGVRNKNITLAKYHTQLKKAYKTELYKIGNIWNKKTPFQKFVHRLLGIAIKN